jgi:hypothetical protein
MSRIRQIKPSWFLDKELRKGTTADAREFYIGLWMLADDAGYIVWDEERIAAELYPFDPIARRERNVGKWADVLERLSPDEPHLIVWDCGHARVPKMPGHQRIAGTQTLTVRRSHCGDPENMKRPDREACETASSRVALQEATEGVAKRSPGRELGRVGNGRERNGSTAPERAPEGASGGSLKDRVGWRPTVVPGRPA